MGRITQKQVVLDHLREQGSITSLDAIKNYGITRLSDRVFVLRNEGYPIITKMITVKTRYGNEEIAVYELQKEQ